MVSDLRILWENDALTLLEARDRYTRSAIRDEFSSDPRNGAIEVDPARHCYVTPVSNSRFSVVWRLEPTAGLAIVEAVVPLANVHSMSVADLQKSVTRARAAESKVSF
jgi:hypothetical protein